MRLRVVFRAGFVGCFASCEGAFRAATEGGAAMMRIAVGYAELGIAGICWTLREAKQR